MADESAPKLTVSYNTLGSRQAFLLRKKRRLGTCKSLTTLSLTVDDQTSLARCLERHSAIKWHKSVGVSPQLPPSHMDRKHPKAMVHWYQPRQTVKLLA
jgi:hypothetical protein